jgi:hypothetical protein
LPAGRIYLALRKKAALEHRTTDELLQLHALEAFVARLVKSLLSRAHQMRRGVDHRQGIAQHGDLPT